MARSVDRGKLVKLLALASSEHDAEALSAARRAAALVRDAGLEWEDVVVLGPRAGWARWFDLAAAYGRAATRRIEAERRARHWQTIARLRGVELAAAKRRDAAMAAGAPEPPPAAYQPEPPPDATGHELIDRLLASPELDARRRARVEAIANWFRRTNELTIAELADLETFARQLRG